MEAWYNMPMPYYEQTRMTGPERDAKILELRRRGYSYSQIGKAVDMTKNGVMHALRRMAEGRPGRDPRA